MPLTQRLKKRNRSDSAVAGAQANEQQQAANDLRKIQEEVEDKLEALKSREKRVEKQEVRAHTVHLSRFCSEKDISPTLNRMIGDSMQHVVSSFPWD